MFSSNVKKVLSSADKNNLLKCVNLRSRTAMTSASEIVDEVKKFEEIPSPPQLPFIGHMASFLKKENAMNLANYSKSLQEKYGDMVRLKIPGMGNGNMVMLFNPEYIKNMYKLEERIPMLPGFTNFELVRKTAMKDRYPTAGLLNNDEDWYNVRTLLNKDMMRPKSALYYTEEMDEIAADAVKIIKNNLDKDDNFEINELCRQFALESIAYVLVGSRINTFSENSDGRRIIEIADGVADFSQTMMFVPFGILKRLPQFKKFCRLQEENMDICSKHLNNSIATMSEDSESLLSKMVARCGKDSSIPLIMGIDSMFAGIDTTGSTAVFLLYHLAQNPDKQEILFKEIVEIVGAEGRLTEAALSKMKYIKAVQIESQRIIPAIWGSSRMYTKDVIIGGYNIPKMSVVVRAGAFTSMDSKSFTEPEKFQPERWLRNHQERHSADPFANIPFGHGARSCIGQRFAKLELFSLMVKVLQNYRLEYAGDEDIGIQTKLVTLPDRQVKIKFHKRQ